MKIAGVIPPLITPISDRDTLDLAGLERILEYVVAGGVHGIFVLGTTGEGPGLSYRLRRELIRQTQELLDGRLPLYVGITDTSLIEALAMAKFSADAGAAAVVAAPPFYFPAGQTELRSWYTQLLNALPLPLLLYNMPGCTKIAIERETLASLIHHDNVAGLKDSSGDFEYLCDAIKLAQRERPDWPVLVGPEHLMAEAVHQGGAGGVAGGANLAPRLFSELYQASRVGNAEEVSRLQALVVQLQELYAIGKYGSSVVKGLKCALELSGVCSGQLAAPFDAFREPERQKVKTWMESFETSGMLPDTVN